MSYTPKYFSVKELVHPDIYNKFRERSLMFFDTKILWTADKLRERYGKAIINTWASGGNRSYSGLRPFDSRIGASYSTHKFGKAVDILFEKATAHEIRVDMKRFSELECFSKITRCEDGVSWLHVDVANIEHAGILFFKP